jgi:D-glycero-alpha-D-manno-heptose-7-phosphate kinase
MTDYVGFCRNHPGDIVNATINKYIYAAARWRDDGRIVLRAPDQGNLTLEVEGPDALKPEGDLALAQAVLQRFSLPRGLEVVTYSEMPAGAGLGSGSSYATCLIAVLDALTGYNMTAYEMAELARECESLALRTTYGWQDQYSPVTGGGVKFMRHWPSEEPRRIEVNHIHLSPGTLADLERGLVVAFSGLSRPARNILDHVAAAVDSGDETVTNTLKAMSQMAVEMRQLLTKGSLDDLGPALSEVWQYHKRLHRDVTNDRLEELYEVAQNHGATGGKVCGAGGGGTMLFFAPPGRDYAVRQALRNLGARVFDISLDMHGLILW